MSILVAQLELALPSRLLLLVLLPAVIWLALVGRRDRSFAQRMTSAALRSLVVALLCFAWAVPSWRSKSERRFVVFVQDRSASVAADIAQDKEAYAKELAGARGSHRLQMVAFAESPIVGDSNFEENAPSAVAGTNIAAAVALAQALCPNDYVPLIILQTDGLETEGRVTAVATATEIPISTVPLVAFARTEIAVDGIDAPSHVAAQQSFDVVTTFAANRPATVTAKLFRDDSLVAQQRIDLAVGETIWRQTTTLDGRRQAVFKAMIEGADDKFAENNSLSAVVLAREPPQVLLVDDEPAAAAPFAALLGRLGYESRVVRPDELPTVDTELEELGLIVVREVAASSLGAQRQAALDRYVRRGGGLLVVGGDKAFGAANYQLTGLEKMLPIVATDQPLEQQRSLALVLVVDKSLSMKDERRLELAKAAAKRGVDVLTERDQVGVIAFGDESQWVSRLAPLADKREVLARIDALEASGLTNMYPAMARAYLALSQADADSRYAIILTDGVPSPGDFGEIAQRMADADITVSTVSLSQGADQTILKDIARIARGNHHHAADPADLPQILEGETRTAVSQVAASETSALAQRRFPGLDVATAPTLTGFVTTRFKPHAQVLLVAGEGDPLLTWWRYGRGVAMALTADMVVANGETWRSWPGYEAFWRTVMAHALRPGRPEELLLDVEFFSGTSVITLDALATKDDGAAPINGAEATLEVARLDDGAVIESYSMQQVAPGRYRVELSELPADVVVLRARVARDGYPSLSTERGVAYRYADEFRLRAADHAKLKLIAAATGGDFEPKPKGAFLPDGRKVEVLHPLFAYFLIAALIVYLADVAVWRWPAGKVQAKHIVEQKAA
jgi:Mg-chelatase subunit ChlD